MARLGLRLIQCTRLLGRERTGFSFKELVQPLSSLLIWLHSLPDHLRRLPGPTHSGRRLLGHAAFTPFQVLFIRLPTHRPSLTLSRPLMGSLSPQPPGVPARP